MKPTSMYPKILNFLCGACFLGLLPVASAAPGIPEIVVEQPITTDLPDGGSKDFGIVAVGSTADITFTIKNTAVGDLRLRGITTTGTHASDFSVTQDPLSPVLQGNSTSFTVRFTPSGSGSRTAAIQIPNNDVDEDPFDILLTGTGLAPEIAVEQPLATDIADAGSKDFGSVFVGSNASLTFTIQNTGNDDLTGLLITKDGTNAADFSITTSPATSVANGDSTTFTVQFAPSAFGARTATLHIASNDTDENPFDITVTGTGFSPDIAVEQPAGKDIATGAIKDFGNVLMGSNTSLTFTIQNAGNSDLTGLAVTKSGTHAADFVVTANPIAPVAAGNSTTFSIQFTPGALGARTASIQIASNDSDENPFVLSLSGTGMSPNIAIEQPAGNNIPDAGSKSFGNVRMGTSKSLTFAIANSGNMNLTGLNITIDGKNSGDFTITTNPVAPVVSGASTTFTVRFTPSAIGTRSAAIHIANNDPTKNPFDITLTGSGAVPDIAVKDPGGINLADGLASISFGKLLAGATVTKTFTIKNSGKAVLQNLSISKSGTHAAEFTPTQPLKLSLAAGASTTFTVTFKPRAAGKRKAAIQIASNDGDENPFDIALVGTGLAPEIAVKSPSGSNLRDGASSIDLGSLKVKSAVSQTFTIKNAGTASLTNLSIRKNGTNAADFSVTQPLKTKLAAGTSTTFTVKFSPSATGTRTAAIHITSNDRNENPFDIVLKGTGLAKSATLLEPKTARAEDVTISDTSSGNRENTVETTTFVTWVDGQKYLALAIPKTTAGWDTNRRVEVSPDLFQWYSGPNHTTVMEDNAEWFKVRDNTPLKPDAKRFIRLK